MAALVIESRIRHHINKKEKFTKDLHFYTKNHDDLASKDKIQKMNDKLNESCKTDFIENEGTIGTKVYDDYDEYVEARQEALEQIHKHLLTESDEEVERTKESIKYHDDVLVKLMEDYDKLTIEEDKICRICNSVGCECDPVLKRIMDFCFKRLIEKESEKTK